VSGVEAVAWLYADKRRSVLSDTRWFAGFVEPAGVTETALYPQSAIDTLRAQLEAAEAENRTRAEDYARLTELWKPDEARYVARAEAAEANAARLRDAGALLSSIAFNLAQRSQLTDYEKQILEDARKGWDLARTKEETNHE
jgi:hypothetical protein